MANTVEIVTTWPTNTDATNRLYQHKEFPKWVYTLECPDGWICVTPDDYLALQAQTTIYERKGDVPGIVPVVERIDLSTENATLRARIVELETELNDVHRMNMGLMTKVSFLSANQTKSGTDTSENASIRRTNALTMKIQSPSDNATDRPGRSPRKTTGTEIA